MALRQQLDEMIREHGLNITFSKTPSPLAVLPTRPSAGAGASDNPYEYGVTITVDVEADSPEDATETFVEQLGISNTDSLTYHVQNLHTGSQWEF